MDEAYDVLARMTSTLSHRGPDDHGYWLDPETGVGLGHTRLAVIDTSPAGHQPMHSPCGRYVIVFNGEIYNFGSLRLDLARRGRRFVTHTDTEVLLTACMEWGVAEALQRLNGMFAFAFWDGPARTLYLARDRIGEKPLFWGWAGPTFVFGSELKSLRAHPAFDKDLDRDALALYLRHNYVPAPHSIYRGIRKLGAGSFLKVKAGRCEGPVSYWDPGYVAERCSSMRNGSGEDELLDRLDILLRDAVQMRMVADVPLGAFLSGGIDSSMVVALMQAQSGRPVRTFSAGFHEDGYDEAPYARKVAAHLGTDHTELYVTPAEAMAMIPSLPDVYDEPFGDSSQIPTMLLAALTRRHVTVSLSGDGGDELFGGYDRYLVVDDLWRRLRRVPRSVRAVGGSIASGLGPHRLSALIRAAGPLLSRGLRGRDPGSRLPTLGQILAARRLEDVYLNAISLWEDPLAIVRRGREAQTAMTTPRAWPNGQGSLDRMMYLDLVAYLPDDLLVKVDRATMAVALEGRMPLLDHRVVEFSWQVPPSLKVRDGRGKYLLRRLLARYVPPELFERPKMGFGVPVGSWLRGPLREWAEDLLSEGRLREDGFFDPRPIRTRWEQHLQGRRDWKYHLWVVLMFQAWLDRWG